MLIVNFRIIFHKIKSKTTDNFHITNTFGVYNISKRRFFYEQNFNC